MLVLSRKTNERIIIAEGEIIITVVGVRRDGSVKLGIDAPDDIPIHREEVQISIDRNKHEANHKSVDC